MTNCVFTATQTITWESLSLGRGAVLDPKLEINERFF